MYEDGCMLLGHADVLNLAQHRMTLENHAAAAVESVPAAWS